MGVPFTAAVASADGTMWSSNPFDKDPENPAHWTSGLVARFAKPATARTAKLVVRIGNTFWADTVFARLFGLMGTSWQPWYQKVGRDPAIRDKTYRFMSDQGVGLKVELQTANGWRDAGFFHPTGPFGVKDDILELDLADAPGDELVVRLRGGTFFWTVDAVNVDYSADVPVRVQALAPLAATDGAGLDVRQALIAADDVHFAMPEPGNFALVRYAAPPPAAGLERSLLLRSRGYYTIHPTPSQAAPDLATLLAIRQRPELFLKYSLAELQKMARPHADLGAPVRPATAEEARP